MQAAKREVGSGYSKHVFFSLLLHLVLLSILVFSLDFTSPMPVLQNSAQNTEVINAMVMSMPAAPKKMIQPQKPLPPLPQPVKPIQSTKPIDKKPILTEVKKPTVVIPNKKPKPLQQEKIAQDLLADLKKQTVKKKVVQHKTMLNAFEKEMKDLAAKSLQQQMLQEQKRIAGARAQQVQGVVDKYKALILQTISQNWLVPTAVNKKLYAELMIRVAPGGTVLEVQLIKSSGDDGLDRSARAAVFKSSPLPVPTDSDAFEPFRQFVLKVKPENVLTADNWMS